jgi:dehydrogenase/reductase SDR family protein 12
MSDRGDENDGSEQEFHGSDYIGQNDAMSKARQIVGALVFYGRFAASFSQVGYLVRRVFWPPFKPDFRGQRWLVTGASGGLGRQMVWAALQGGATVIAAARSETKLRELVSDALAAGLSGLEIERCDFASMFDTRQLVERLSSRGGRIDVLVNNVGVMNDELVVTPEGLEASFASNLLAHYVLTEGLIERGVLGERSTVINITSGGGYSVPLSLALLNVTDPAQFSGVVAYAAHKRAQISLTSFWRRQHDGKGVGFYVMHPGWADTAGVQRSLPRFRRLFRPVLRDARSGADTALWLAATRPSQPSQELVWFDRKIRAAHAFAYTKATKETATDLVNYLASISRSSVREER